MRSFAKVTVQSVGPRSDFIAEVLGVMQFFLRCSAPRATLFSSSPSHDWATDGDAPILLP